MSTGYTRKRTSTPTRRSNRPKTFTGAVKDVLEQNKLTKYRSVLLTVEDRPQINSQDPSIPNVAAIKQPYVTMKPGAWVAWGHLLANLQTPLDGKAANLFQRGGDEIHMKNLKFDIQLEGFPGGQGNHYRFVVWRSNRMRDLCQNYTLNREQYANDVAGIDRPEIRFGAPPLIQTNQVGPVKGLSGVSTSTTYADRNKYAKAIDGAGNNLGFSNQVYPCPSDQGNSYELDCDPIHAMIDSERCKVLHDEVIYVAPQNLSDGGNVIGSGATAAPKNRSGPGCYRGTRYISYDKDIEYSNDFGESKDLFLAYKNNSDYINAAIVQLPVGTMDCSYGTLSTLPGEADAKAKIVCTFSWKDKNSAMNRKQAIH